MAEVKFGEQVIRVRATPLTLLFYRKEFGNDMTTDYLRIYTGVMAVFPELSSEKLKNLGNVKLDADSMTMKGLSAMQFDALGVLQMVWAMAKTEQYGQSWPGFEEWVAKLGDINFFDGDMLAAVFEVAADGLFRGAKTKGDGSGDAS